MVNIRVFLLGLLSVFLIVSAFLTETTHAASVNRKRSTTNICIPGARCGWYVYNRMSRVPEDAHKACDCPKDEECVRSEDDISISAYAYRCRPASTNNGTNLL